jgi:hypothetical protein
MKTWYLLVSILIILFYCSNIFAQEKPLSLVLKGGNADYNISIGSFGGGEPDYTYWKTGPQFSAGIEFPLNSKFSFQGLANFSIHNFDERFSWGEKVNNAQNRLYDIMGNIKYNIGIFYLIGGMGFSYQNGDAVKYLVATEFHNAEILHNAKNKFVLAGLLGLGFDIKIYQQFSIIAEADINMRQYMGTAAVLGIKYSLLKI